MKMKLFLAFIIFPFSLVAQTVHLHDKEIEYKGEIEVPATGKAMIFEQAVKNLGELVHKNGNAKVHEENYEYSIKAELRLSAPYPIIRKVKCRISIMAKDSSYVYKIDKVSLWEKHRGKDVQELSSEDLVDLMDESGKPAIEAEQILNAIDLNLQKLLTVFKNKMQKEVRPSDPGAGDQSR